ncbi:Crp/Fnr family transcriptional regulator [Anaerosphaera multitolerans]|uniref:Crp/Fnr family transcriptional regulator n=1 Tax=Anaerosphaera multitolerans TaxID=2487351 RepID=A0A437S586_9FIRM|nr:Crp/Fnr family transcriptional regulator [Anaerosphaera multitolerans]RVU54202.1 Crp/Fnr family transcriptional regulator [Anaerosphaera multitolerans]
MSTKSNLFKGLSFSEIEDFLNNNFAKYLKFKKGEEVFLQGEKPEYLFILERGSVVVENTNSSGKRSIVNIFNERGTVFGEVYLYLEGEYDYSCFSNEDTEVLAIPKKALEFNENIDKIKTILLNNMLSILAAKALYLNKKLLISSSYSLREKLAKFFMEQAIDEKTVNLNFTREELADYLGATRPSISRELMNMHNDGLIEVGRKNIKINKEELEKFL